jgi:hypothetical protein
MPKFDLLGEWTMQNPLCYHSASVCHVVPSTLISPKSRRERRRCCFFNLSLISRDCYHYFRIGTDLYSLARDLRSELSELGKVLRNSGHLATASRYDGSNASCPFMQSSSRWKPISPRGIYNAGTDLNFKRVELFDNSLAIV